MDRRSESGPRWKRELALSPGQMLPPGIAGFEKQPLSLSVRVSLRNASAIRTLLSGSFSVPDKWGSACYCGVQTISTWMGISFFTGMVRSEGGGILKSVRVAGMVPTMCLSVPSVVTSKETCR